MQARMFALRSLEPALERRKNSSPRMIFVGERSTEKRNEPVTQKLIDGALVAVHGVERQAEKIIQVSMHCFRADLGGERSGADDVAEQHRHLFALTF